MAKGEKDPLNVRIGAAVKAAREYREIPARFMAEATGVSVGAVGNWESGQNSISSTNFFAVADLLRVDARALSQGDLVYLEDEKGFSATVLRNAPVDPSVLKLWDLLGAALRAKREYRDGVIAAIEEFNRGTGLQSRARSKQGNSRG